MNLLWMLASAAGQSQAAPQGPPNSLFNFAPIFIIFIVFYFLLIRPQQKKQKEQETMLQQLKKGDRILTSGGIYGRIFSVKDDILVITVSENVKLEVAKSAVTRVVE